MEELRALATNVDIGWTLVGAALVFFMQAGFAMVETGLTRAKNAGNIVMKNLMDFCIGTPIYWFIGFGIMFGGTGALIGGLDLFSMKSTDYTTMIFQTVFCATSATIVSGAMAERTKFSSYCIYSALISLFVYPISGHIVIFFRMPAGRLHLPDAASRPCRHQILPDIRIGCSASSERVEFTVCLKRIRRKIRL